MVDLDLWMVINSNFWWLKKTLKKKIPTNHKYLESIFAEKINIEKPLIHSPCRNVHVEILNENKQTSNRLSSSLSKMKWKLTTKTK